MKWFSRFIFPVLAILDTRTTCLAFHRGEFWFGVFSLSVTLFMVGLAIYWWMFAGKKATHVIVWYEECGDGSAQYEMVGVDGSNIVEYFRTKDDAMAYAKKHNLVVTEWIY